VIAVNKCEQPLARTTANDVRQVLALGPSDVPKPPVVLTDALTGVGLDELWAAIEEHGASPGLEERRRRNLAAEVFAVASARARRHLESAVGEHPELARLLEQVQRRELDPLSAVRAILTRVFHVGNEDGPDTR
jgi:LAO/AO transport system kinase